MFWFYRECDMKKEYIIIKNVINVNFVECMLFDYIYLYCLFLMVIVVVYYFSFFLYLIEIEYRII